MVDRTLSRVLAGGVIPVIRAPSAELALKAVDAICAGGIDVVELTMTVPGAVSLIEELKSRFGDDVMVGAGTVLDADTARACIGAGAEFVVCPIVDRATVTFCRARGVPVIPGALTPTEIVEATRAGADIVKVFPCGALGGASYIRSLRGPFPDVRLVPTGGVSMQTVGDFIRAGASAVGVGADLVDIGQIVEGPAHLVTENARRYLDAVRQAREVRS
jgi:2-dehydro-3-deoxyphosphogluconate aldolase / (4S)-4-hydroxy-2-oxoglutarate aldolase